MGGGHGDKEDSHRSCREMWPGGRGEHLGLSKKLRRCSLTLDG